MSLRQLIFLLGFVGWAGTSFAAMYVADPRVQVLATPQPVEDFVLTDHDGRKFQFSDLRGGGALVFFGFTRCPSVCPAALFKMRLLAASIRNSGDDVPTALMISVDGERDTPELLKTYLAGYPDNFTGLTGDPKVVRRIATDFKAIFFKGLPSDDAGNYQVEHTSMIYLVDANGRLRATFFDATVEAMADTVRQAMDDRTKKKGRP